MFNISSPSALPTPHPVTAAHLTSFPPNQTSHPHHPLPPQLWPPASPGTPSPLRPSFSRQHLQCSNTFLHRFNQKVLLDTTPLPDSVPKVPEIGASSAPLLSASYFIGARCKAFNDDYMVCKTEANGRGELECLKEGRKVTRCAASV